MRWTIGRKLFGLSGVGACMVLAVGTASYWGFSQLNTGVERLSTSNAVLRNHLEGDMMHDALRGDVLSAILANTDEEKETVRTELEKHANKFRAVLQENASLALTPAVQQAIKDTEPALADYIASAESMVKLATHDRAAAQEQLGSFQKAFEILEDKMEQLSDLIEAGAKASQTDAAEATRTSRATVLGIAVGAIGLLTLVALLITRGITKPLGRTVAVLQDIAQGEGDLTIRLAVTGHDEVSDLSRGFNTFMDKLHDMIVQVAGTAQHVASASEHLSSTALQITAGVQAQAASLEQTAASLEELTGTVKHNADNAKQADHLALESRHTAEQSGTVVTEAVGSMERLTTSARRITEIISVINSLAFQTNLLALNASVEAARAGEHGRGFAVVADEVRKLAQRSAEAAKEIEALIRDSGQNVEAGAALVNKAGQALQDIVGSVQHVSTIVAEIASASHEQANGIEQVNNAVTQMDQVTQANAAQTESLSSTARSLAGQAMELQTLVGRFRLRAAQALAEEVAPPDVPSRRSRVARSPKLTSAAA